MLICIEFASEPVNCSGFHTGEGVRSPIVLSKFHSVVMHSAHIPFQFVDDVFDSGNRHVD